MFPHVLNRGSNQHWRCPIRLSDFKSDHGRAIRTIPLRKGCLGCVGKVCQDNACLSKDCLGKGCLGKGCFGKGCLGKGCLCEGCLGEACVRKGCFLRSMHAWQRIGCAQHTKLLWLNADGCTPMRLSRLECKKCFAEAGESHFDRKITSYRHSSWMLDARDVTLYPRSIP